MPSCSSQTSTQNTHPHSSRRRWFTFFFSLHPSLPPSFNQPNSNPYTSPPAATAVRGLCYPESRRFQNKRERSREKRGGKGAYKTISPHSYSYSLHYVDGTYFLRYKVGKSGIETCLKKKIDGPAEADDAFIFHSSQPLHFTSPPPPPIPPPNPFTSYHDFLCAQYLHIYFLRSSRGGEKKKKKKKKTPTTKSAWPLPGSIMVL